FLEPGTHPPKFLQGNLALVAQHGDGSQADDVAEGVDAAKRPSAVLVDERGREEAGVVPVPDLPIRQPGQAAHMLCRECHHFGHSRVTHRVHSAMLSFFQKPTTTSLTQNSFDVSACVSSCLRDSAAGRLRPRGSRCSRAYGRARRTRTADRRWPWINAAGWRLRERSGRDRCSQSHYHRLPDFLVPLLHQMIGYLVQFLAKRG